MTKVTVDGSGILSSSLAGLVRIQSVPNPTAPTVTVNGTTGTTTYSYYIVAIDKNGNKTAPSPLGTITTGNATLSASNYNNLNWSIPTGAVSVDVIRSVGGTAQGSIALSLVGTSIADTGLIATAYTASVRNNTADLQVDGNIGIGVVPSTLWQESLAGTVNVPVGVAVQSGGINISPNIVAANNSDVLIGLLVQPTFNDNGKTGVGHLAAQFNANVLFTNGLQVSGGTVGIGVAPTSGTGLTSTPTTLTGALQIGVAGSPVGTSATTGNGVIGVFGRADTAATVFEAPNAWALYAATPIRGTGSTIATSTGVWIEGQAAGRVNNYGVFIGAPSGGTGQNIGLVNNGTTQLTGGVAIGGSAPPGSNQLLVLGGTLNSSGGSAQGLVGVNTLVAQIAANDQLYGIQSQPSVNSNGKTSVVTAAYLAAFGTITGGSGFSQIVGVNVAAFSGGGSNNYGVLVGAVGGAGTNNYGVYINAPSGASTDNFALVANGACLLGVSPGGPTFTQGHVYLPMIGGAPSGVPADGSFGNRAPIVIDNVNNKIWVRIGGTWKGVVVA